MTDQELLEAAAMAAGYTEFCVASFLSKGYRVREGVGYGWIPWNPLTSDGDALRLAVELGITVSHMRSSRPDVEDHKVCVHEYNITEFYGGSPAAATRRAIVRAAAEIGKKP